jgi:hypothetical protein
MIARTTPARIGSADAGRHVGIWSHAGRRHHGLQLSCCWCLYPLMLRNLGTPGYRLANQRDHRQE